MADSPLPTLIFRLNQNINAIAVAVDELAMWVDQQGSTKTSDVILKQLDVLDANADIIAEMLAALIAKEG